jgi:hypothetical protein
MLPTQHGATTEQSWFQPVLSSSDHLLGGLCELYRVTRGLFCR